MATGYTQDQLVGLLSALVEKGTDPGRPAWDEKIIAIYDLLAAGSVSVGTVNTNVPVLDVEPFTGKQLDGLSAIYQLPKFKNTTVQFYVSGASVALKLRIKLRASDSVQWSHPYEETFASASVEGSPPTYQIDNEVWGEVQLEMYDRTAGAVTAVIVSN